MWVVLEEVSGDADDDNGADPGHDIAASDGEAESLGGNDEDHFDVVAWV